MNDTTKKSSIIAIIGEPNAGKSTLVNQMVGAKVAIVSPKVQTTRTSLRGIVMVDNTQLILVDTPGIFKPKKSLERNIVNSAYKTLAEVDNVAIVIDARRGITENFVMILKKMQEYAIPSIIIINKVDLIPKERLLPLIEKLKELQIASEIFMVSALKNDGVEELKSFFASKATHPDWFYPEDQISDAPMRFMAAEITREKLFLRLQQELPYSLAVETELWQEQDDGSVTINQVIYTMKDNQKKIILGKSGQMIKLVGQSARLEIEKLMGTRVHLFLHVKVRDNWVNNQSIYQLIS